MKKLLKILLVFVAIIIAMGIAFAACVGGVASSVNDSIEEVEKENKEKDAKVADMAKDMKWDVKTKDGVLTAKSVFTNTSNEDIDYIQFNYKVLDKDGVTVEDSFTNVTNVKVGESVKIEITSYDEHAKEIKITEVRANAF